MKIAFFTDSYYPQLNGVTISVANFAKELRKNGHTVYICAPQTKQRQKEQDKDIINLPSVKILSSYPPILMPLPTSYKGYRQIVSIDFDLVHAHGNGPFSLLGYQVAKMKQIPFALTFHSMFSKYTHYFFNGKVVKPKMVETYLRIFANICDAIITPSEKMKKELQVYGVKKPISVIPNFVYQQQFNKKNTHYLHKKFNIPLQEPIILTVGRVGKEKNFEFLISMFKELTKINKTCHLVIAGEGPEKKQLQKLAEKLEISKRVHFPGRVSTAKMPDVYADAYLFAFSSHTEVHPMVTLEAIAAGLPVVVGQDEAFDGAAVDGYNGFRAPLKEKVFAEKIHKILQDQKLRETFSENSKKLIEKNFSPQHVVNDLIDLYKKTINDQKVKTKSLSDLNKVALLKLRKTARVFIKIFSY
ncbi:glycosyltransferase [Candidatus Roizmanbacteria bacterium]|nr:glycosyltransferase [Candidatus Roizmanbacteria bacterium]